MATKSEIMGLLENVRDHGKVAQRLQGGTWIDVSTVSDDGVTLKVVTLHPGTIELQVWKRPDGKKGSTFLTLNRRQHTMAREWLNTHFWPEAR